MPASTSTPEASVAEPWYGFIYRLIFGSTDRDLMVIYAVVGFNERWSVGRVNGRAVLLLRLKQFVVAERSRGWDEGVGRRPYFACGSVTR